MKIKVGDYVRTKNGICKIVAFYSNAIFNDKNKRIENNSIIKSSPNIIDLIEVGDYVNEQKVIYVDYLTNGPRKGTKVVDYYIAPNTLNYFTNEDIKSIVTKEQFSSMEYKIER